LKECEIVSQRNRNGLKNSIYCYRTFGGERYIAWLVCITPDIAKRYREAGIRCRTVGDTLFIHLMDEDDARAKRYLEVR
jgi:hypothetical protein